MTILQEPITDPIVVENFVGGEWIRSAGEYHDIMDPARQRLIAHVPTSTADEVNEAVQEAKEAFPEWRSTPPVTRARYLHRLRELMEENFEELSRIQTMEHGKTIDESRGETRRGIEQVEVASGIPSLMMGYNLEDIASGIDEFLIRQPLGVFAVIAPFNFPFMVPLWFAPYAVATGNCVIVKPSPRDPISQTKIAELVDEADFPPGVWQVVNGGTDASTALIDHPDVDGVAFVGSTPVAKEVYRRAGAAGKRAIAQGGAKNYVVVMPDANTRATIPALLTSFYGNAGQRCLSGANLLIVGDDSFHDSFMDELSQATGRIRVGYGLDESVQMGPMQSPDGKDRALSYIEKGVDDGARLRLRRTLPRPRRRVSRDVLPESVDLRGRPARHGHRTGGDIRAGHVRAPGGNAARGHRHGSTRTPTATRRASSPRAAGTRATSNTTRRPATSESTLVLPRRWPSSRSAA